MVKKVGAPMGNHNAAKWYSPKAVKATVTGAVGAGLAVTGKKIQDLTGPSAVEKSRARAFAGRDQAFAARDRAFAARDSAIASAKSAKKSANSAFASRLNAGAPKITAKPKVMISSNSVTKRAVASIKPNTKVDTNLEGGRITRAWLDGNVERALRKIAPTPDQINENSLNAIAKLQADYDAKYKFGSSGPRSRPNNTSTAERLDRNFDRSVKQLESRNYTQNVLMPVAKAFNKR